MIHDDIFDSQKRFSLEEMPPCPKEDSRPVHILLLVVSGDEMEHRLLSDPVIQPLGGKESKKNGTCKDGQKQHRIYMNLQLFYREVSVFQPADACGKSQKAQKDAGRNGPDFVQGVNSWICIQGGGHSGEMCGRYGGMRRRRGTARMFMR